MAQFTQEERLISIESPLGKDELLLTSFQGSEHISKIFEFQLDVISYNLQLNPEKLIGELVTVTCSPISFSGFNCRLYEITSS